MKYLIIVVFLMFSEVTSQNYKQFLIAYWSFDDSTANDHSGNGYHGTIIHTPTPVSGANNRGTAFHFIGKGYDYLSPQVPEGDHIILPRIPFESFNEFTTELWAKDESMSWATGDFYLFFGFHNNGWLGIGNHTLQRYDGDTVLYSLFSVGAGQDGIDPINYLFNLQLRCKWVHYCFTYKNNIITAYVDGKIIGSKNEILRISGNTAGIACHWWNYGGDKSSARFTGSIDEVKIFTKALTDDEVENEYKGFSISARTKSPCEGDTVTLFADSGFSEYNWSTGEKSQKITVNQSGLYTVTAKLNNNTYSASFTVNMLKKPQPVISVISAPCNGHSGKLTLLGKYPSVKWSTYESTASIDVIKPGKYSVTVTDSNGCSGYAEIVVNEITPGKINITQKGKTFFCKGDTVELTADEGYINYSWGEASEGTLINQIQNKLIVTKPGRYYVKAMTKDSCLVVSDTLNIDINSSKNILSLEGYTSDSYMDFDSVNYGQLLCKALKIRNNSNVDYVLPNVNLKNNIDFSIPQSQFSLIIPANSTKELIICCSPIRTGQIWDTLSIPDICYEHNLRLKADGIGNSYSSISSCSVPIELKTSTLPFKKFIITGMPYPNPSINHITIPYSSLGKADEVITAKLYSIYNFHSINYKKNINYSAVSKDRIVEKGDLYFDLSEFSSGIYYLWLRLDTDEYLLPLVLLK